MASTSHSTQPASMPRFGGVDALRGFAVAMMIAYHLCYDLTWFGYANWRLLDDIRWIVWRNVIVTTFLFVVGLSLALRGALRASERAFWMRWLQIAGAAALVSVVTWVQFGPRFVYFGILHFIAAALLIGRLLRPLGIWNAVLGGIAIVAGVSWSDPSFTPRTLNWIGFSPTKPLTEDYVPLFPWLGVVLCGLAFGHAWRRRRFTAVPGLTALHDALPAFVQHVLRFLGRYSLSIYLVHQPILMGVLWLAKHATG
ncbi:MAG TPA: heparan-alpha-glucosaminide N-acetyltransferase [Burkholderiaceae bacterium]|nr:heparan-alpha-glucosaminide N-acetyltransferase [Burkholderiaceae bacterium]